jgi:hypothetical protein
MTEVLKGTQRRTAASSHRRKRSTRFAGLLGHLAAVGFIAAVISGASMAAAPAALAASGYYCQDQGYIPGYTNCPVSVSDYVTSDSYNQALTYYPNDGDYVCETITNSGGGWISRVCGQNQALSGTVTVDTYDHQHFYVGNDSPKPHYIRGYWAANF